MRSSALLGILGLVFAFAAADAATVTGTVKGPDGAAFRGAFVQARNAKTKVTVSVLSDNQGRYRVRICRRRLSAQIRAPGFSAADPQEWPRAHRRPERHARFRAGEGLRALE